MRKTQPHVNDGKRNIRGQASRKFDKFKAAWIHYLSHPEGVTDAELQAAIGAASERAAANIRYELPTIRVAKGRYTIAPTSEDLQLARAIIRRRGRDNAKGLHMPNVKLPPGVTYNPLTGAFEYWHGKGTRGRRHIFVPLLGDLGYSVTVGNEDKVAASLQEAVDMIIKGDS